jgi:hypothetical protein
MCPADNGLRNHRHLIRDSLRRLLHFVETFAGSAFFDKVCDKCCDKGSEGHVLGTAGRQPSINLIDASRKTEQHSGL